MDGAYYLFAAFGITWVIIYLYMYSMLRRLKSLENRISRLKTCLQKDLTVKVL